MLPDGWKNIPIERLCASIVDCVNKTAPVVDFETPYKMIRTTNVRHGRVDLNSVRFVEEEIYDTWVRRGAPERGDIIFTREAPVGESGILNSDDKVFLGQRTMMYRANTELSVNLFILYSLQTGFCQKQIEDFSNGGTVAHMRVPDCGKIIIRTPPLPEQKKIAQILSTWDKAITTTEQLIANSQQQKKALMQQLLTGKKRLAGFDGDWKEVRLAFLTDGKKQKGRIVPTNENSKGLPYIGSTSFNGVFELFTDSKKAIKCEEDDLLVLWDGENAGKSTTGLIGVVSSTVVKFILKKELSDSMFINNLFIQDNYKIRAIREGSGIPHMPKDFEHWYKVLLPTLIEQQQIVQVLSNADQEIKTLQQKLAYLKQEKKALMQQLLTGKRRVNIHKDDNYVNA